MATSAPALAARPACGRSPKARARSAWRLSKVQPTPSRDRLLRQTRRHLAAAPGDRYAQQRRRLTRLVRLPATGLTQAQVRTARRLMRRLDSFAGTQAAPASRRVLAYDAWTLARWEASAVRDRWYREARTQLVAAPGPRYGRQVRQLRRLARLPATSLTPAQLARAQGLHRRLDTFFGTRHC